MEKYAGSILKILLITPCCEIPYFHDIIGSPQAGCQISRKLPVELQYKSDQAEHLNAIQIPPLSLQDRGDCDF